MIRQNKQSRNNKKRKEESRKKMSLTFILLT